MKKVTGIYFIVTYHHDLKKLSNILIKRYMYFTTMKKVKKEFLQRPNLLVISENESLSFGKG